MSPMLRFLVALSSLLAALALPAAADAAERLEIAEGSLAAVEVAPDGTAHIAWRGNEPLNSTLRYCRLPFGATACDRRLTLIAEGKGDSVSRPFVMIDGTTLRVLQYRYGLTDGLTPDKFAAVYMFSSTNGGDSFDANGVQVGTVPFSDAVRGPDLQTKEGPVAGISLTTHAVTEGELYQRVLVNGSATTSFVNLSADHPYNGAVGMVDPETPLVVFTGLSGETQFKRYTGPADPSTAAGWPKKATTIKPDADWIHLAGGLSGLFMLDTNTENKVEVRKFDGAGFGAGVTRSNWTGESPQDHLAQDDQGMLHMFLPQITASCCPLLYSYSANGTSWSSVSYPMPALATQVRSDFLANHHGVAVWHSGTGLGSKVYALRVGPPVALGLPPASKAPAKASASGGKVVVKIKGKLKVPPGIAAVDVCAGKLVATLRNGSKKLATRRLRLGADCSFAARVSVPKSKVGASKALGLRLKLRKSRTAKAAKRNYKIKVRR